VIKFRIHFIVSRLQYVKLKSIVSLN